MTKRKTRVAIKYKGRLKLNLMFSICFQFEIRVLENNNIITITIITPIIFLIDIFILPF